MLITINSDLFLRNLLNNTSTFVGKGSFARAVEKNEISDFVWLIQITSSQIYIIKKNLGISDYFKYPPSPLYHDNLSNMFGYTLYLPDAIKVFDSVNNEGIEKGKYIPYTKETHELKNIIVHEFWCDKRYISHYIDPPINKGSRVKLIKEVITKDIIGNWCVLKIGKIGTIKNIFYKAANYHYSVDFIDRYDKLLTSIETTIEYFEVI